MAKYAYSEVFGRLTFETATIIFIKKNGEIRTMLATRNLQTAAIYNGFMGRELGGHDTRCNINNGNLAVIDLMLGEARSFNIERVISVDYHGTILTQEELDNEVRKFIEFNSVYEAKRLDYNSLE